MSMEILAFSIFSVIAVLGALGMATTMSMFRSGMFLMASFVGVAGLFVLLSADLLGMVQVMMYVGGMLMMILFMVLFSGDPGGEMMTGMMKLPPVEKLFSLGLAHEDERGDGDDQEGKGMEDMSMFTPVKKSAAVLAGLVGTVLVLLLVSRRSFGPAADVAPDPSSAARIGHLLMGDYMIAFEGAGLLILLGIFGAVYLARPGRHPDPSDRVHLKAAVAAHPAEVEESPE